MNIVDCFMYFDEDMILDIRLNVLDKYVSHFIICEANFNHNGTKRDLRFEINNFQKFRKKITYIPLDKQPENLRIVNQNDSVVVKNSKILDNALLRENFQRNFLQNKIKDFHEDDLIIISDVDEIPNLQNFKYKKKITFFEQKMFYYKLNLIHPDFLWYGSKICKKKHLISPQWLRNIKNNRYSLFRLDTLFSKKKYIDKYYVKNGGWHFSNLKDADNIELKLKSYLHHTDYEFEELGKNKIEYLIQNNKTIYDMYGDKTSKKFGDNKRKNLEKYEIDKLPTYIKNNLNKYKDWID